MIKVKNMESPRSGKPVANQFIIEDACSTWFQSYDTLIARKTVGQIFLDETYWNYSLTTSKYRNVFLGETTKETKEKIRTGEYEMIDLNKG